MTFFEHAGIPAVSYDNMVEHFYADSFTGFSKLFRYRNVFVAGGGVPAGMVMDEDHRGCGIPYRIPEGFPWMYQGRGQGTLGRMQ